MTHCFIIAEAGVNHNGDLQRGLALVDAAAEAGADSVKFQTFRADKIVSAGAGRAPYQERAIGGGDQLSMLRSLELSDVDHGVLAERCRERGILFMSTPFDREDIPMLANLGMDRIKIPSGELVNPLLLLDAARSGLPIILSTGMATLAEVGTALDLLAFGLTGGETPSLAAIKGVRETPKGFEALRQKVTLLHCTSEYPAAPETINLRAMDTLSEAFGVPVGLSDHSEGIAIPIAAAARGARVIEKHFTLDRGLPGPDHQASLEPGELKEMVTSIRSVVLALGPGGKTPTPGELNTATFARRSVVAARALVRGEVFDASSLTLKRPGTGLSPMVYWDLLGKTASRDYEAHEMIEE
ncbi:MAG: N-acetylneuraminate synthase [Rhodospirillum sp.]|nr:N-acetylneuraminate synthase [Rhodospirillum sp.]MCF8489117.1 N-acetylneuraminate synthase [Rhodospirillum sp.]MCF8498907.1 N-acetylneuraminate synthase [Rhodospirillum sp.]